MTSDYNIQTSFNLIMSAVHKRVVFCLFGYLWMMFYKTKIPCKNIVLSRTYLCEWGNLLTRDLVTVCVCARCVKVYQCLRILSLCPSFLCFLCSSSRKGKQTRIHFTTLDNESTYYIYINTHNV